MTEVDISPAGTIARLAQRDPKAQSVMSDERAYTRSEVHQAAADLAGLLAARGITPGSRVAYVGRNSPMLLFSLLACAHLGAVFVPVNFRLAPGELRHVLTHCGAHTVLVDPEQVPCCASVAASVPVSQWLTADTDGRPSQLPPGWLSTRTDPVRQPPRRVTRTCDDLALIMYTSGTSGRAKGVMLTYGNLWWSAENVAHGFGTRADDVALAVAPLFHIGGLNAFTLPTLLRGGTVLVRRAFDPARTLTDLLNGGVTSVFGVPQMFAAVARCPGFRDADLSGVRSAIVAGAAAPATLITRYAEQGMLLRQSWGMTETAPAACAVPAESTLAKAGSAGLPLRHTRIRLVDPDDGRDIDRAGTTGEILVRGRNVTPGYWHDAEATRAAFTDDGWLRTGDLATRDADGYLRIVGRRSDVINSGGEKIHPAEVERALAGLPGVTDVAVIGVPDPEWGETVLAVLEIEAGAGSALEDVRAHGSRAIARYKLPTRVVCMPELPRNGAGKADKNHLRELLKG